MSGGNELCPVPWKSGTAATLSLSGVNTYTGKTLLNGNVTQLIDGGTLSGAGGVLGDIDVNYATFTLNNTGTTDLTDRVNDNAAINLRGGTISFLGRAQTASTETLGSRDPRSGHFSNQFDLGRHGCELG